MNTTSPEHGPALDAASLITVTDGIERPAAGRWKIPPAALDAVIGTRLNHRTTTLDVEGVLDVAAPSEYTTLTLTTGNARTQPSAGFRYHGILTAADRLGRWHFEGTARCYGSTYRLHVDARYNGIFDRHHPVCWIELHHSRVVSEPTARRHKIIRSISGHLNATAPAAELVPSCADDGRAGR